MELWIDGVTKKYSGKVAVNNISAQLTPGVIGLLGANGAGKTTLMRMICGVLKPSEGSITFEGMDASEEMYRDALAQMSTARQKNAYCSPSSPPPLYILSP